MRRLNFLQVIGFVTFLAAVHCEWICSDKSKVTINGNTVNFTSWEEVTCKYKTQPVNNKSNRYYEFTIVDAGFGFAYGLSVETSKDDGKKGIYFSTFGVSDGRVTNYDFPNQYVENGDKIGFLTEETENDLKVYLYLNKHPLGMIYHLSPKPSNTLYPYIKSLSRQSVAIEELETLPDTQEMERIPIEGVYQFNKYSENYGTEVECTEEWKNMTFEFVLSSPRPYPLGETVEPKLFWIHITFNGFNNYCDTSKQNEKWSKFSCSDQSGPLPVGESLEGYKFIEKIINHESSFDVNESEKTLTISSDNGSKVILKQISQISGAAVTISPFEN